MRAWSDWPLPRVVDLSALRLGERIAEENGQSSGIHELADLEGWLVKLYKPGFPEEPPDVLDRLIALPDRMGERDLALVDSATCWPVSRILSGGRTVAVALARAPEEFFSRAETPVGQEVIPMALDQLVETDHAFYAQRGWRVPDLAERLRVACNLLRIGVLLERHDVVYGDWSYANCFWTRDSGRVFLIDMDSCGLSSRAWVLSNTWDDPAAPDGRLTVTTDRYRLAVAVLRVLTGVRGTDPRPAYEALPGFLRDGEPGEALLAAITAPPDLRPGCMELLESLETELYAMTSAPAPTAPALPEPSAPPERPAPVAAPRSSSAPVRRPVPPERTPGRGAEHRYEPEQEDWRYASLIVPGILACLALLSLLVLGGLVDSLFP